MGKEISSKQEKYRLSEPIHGKSYRLNAHLWKSNQHGLNMTLPPKQSIIGCQLHLLPLLVIPIFEHKPSS